ncbi:hypothetical protein [Nicoliella lavandulae]|uniref:Cell division protein n=1 Tax=Nicoliella lavandulae TaxID=3082954 RepID=A0ABU8SLM7_9LACO
MKTIAKYKIKWQTGLPYLFIILLSLIVMVPQWHAQAAFIGLDSVFHMNRFYDTMMQIKTGHYSYFQSFFGFGQSGRIVNAVYGPLFAYLNGAILLIVHNWVNYQLISTYLLFIIAGFLMYRLLIKNHVQMVWSIVMAVCYMFSTPILYWINGQQFTAWGAAFVPLLMLSGTEMMRNGRIAWIKLALSMTLVLQIHNVTSAICALALVPFFVTGWLKSDQRKQMGLALLKAIGLTLILSANVWGGMLELFSSNHLLPVVPDLHLAADSLYFIHGDTKLSYTAAILFGIAFLYLVIRWRQISIDTKVIILDGAVFLWISSHFFPWALLSKLVPAVDSVIQNPIRFLVIPYALLYLALGIMLSDQTIKWGRLVSGIVVCLVALLLVYKDVRHVQAKVRHFRGEQVVISNRFSTIRTKNPDILRSALRSNNLRAFLRLDSKATPDYMPTTKKISVYQYAKFKPYTRYRKQIIEPNLNAHREVKNGVMSVNWVNNSSKTTTKQLPVVKYGHSIVTLNGKQVKNVKISSIGALIVKLQPGYNHLTIRYQSAGWFKALIWLSIASWIILIGYGGIRIFRRKA